MRFAAHRPGPLLETRRARRLLVLSVVATGIAAACRIGPSTGPRPDANGSEDFDAFTTLCTNAFARHLQGDPRPYLDLWSRADDVAVLGAGGSHVERFARVQRHLTSAARSLHWTGLSTDPLLTSAAADLGVTVTLEHMTRVGEQPGARTLRTTQAYRREHGGWRLFLRHANVVSPADEEHEQWLIER